MIAYHLKRRQQRSPALDSLPDERDVNREIVIQVCDGYRLAFTITI